MPLSPEDRALVADMKQREFHLKRRQRATDAILYQARRYRAVLVFLVAVACAAIGFGIHHVVVDTVPGHRDWWLASLVSIALSASLGVQLGQSLLRTEPGRRLLARNESRLHEKYTGDLHSGRRWLQFYYQGEDISAYVPQVLYFLDEEQRFDSVDTALAFAKENRRENATFAAGALDRFNRVAAQTNLVVISSTDEPGWPSSRIMRFVKSDRPGVWYVTTAPEGPKVGEFDHGRIALVTAPTESGATISSNRVQIRRAHVAFSAVAGMYRAQVPGYVDGMTEDEQQRELVYELTLRSAKVDTWLDHELIEFGGS